MPRIDALVVGAVIAGTAGLLAARAFDAGLRFRRLRRINDLLEKAVRELEHERIDGTPR